MTDAAYAPPQPNGGGILGGIGRAIGGLLGLPGQVVGGVSGAFQGAAEARALQHMQNQAAVAMFQQRLEGVQRLGQQFKTAAEAPNASPEAQARWSAFQYAPFDVADTYVKGLQPEKLGKGEEIANAYGAGTRNADVSLNQGVMYDSSGRVLGTVGQPHDTAAGTTTTEFVPTVNGGLPGSAGPGPAAGGAPAPALSAPPGGPAPTTPGVLDPHRMFNDYMLKVEGGYNPKDANGSPTKYGINQAANPSVNVKTLTPDQAGDIFANKYFKMSGAGNLPPALGAIHADTYFLNPRAASNILQQSGGDPARYMQLREQWMQNDLATNPNVRPYAQAWTDRNAKLWDYANSLSGAPTQPSPNAPAAASQPAPSAPSGANVLVQGKTNQPISAAEAMQLGLPPGVYQRDPMGKIEQVTKPTDDDLARLTSLNGAVDHMRALVAEQQAFLAHNHNLATGLPLGNPEFHGIPLNPVSEVLTHYNPDAQAMEASAGKQLFMVKPDNAGARILQSELPYWEVQTQSLSKAGDVNQQILRDNAHKMSQAQAQAAFFQSWLYNRGNLKGADEAFNRYWSKSKFANPVAPGSVPAPQAGGPQPGHIEGGYVFLGGDPSSQSSWRKQ